MLPPSAVLVDMDGTLIDTEVVIVPVLRRTLRELAGCEITREEARRYIGPPLGETMSRFAGDGGEELAQEMVARYRDLYAQRQYDIALFDGVEAMARRLVDAGVTLALATSKPEDRAQLLLDHHGIADLFTHVCGAPPDDGPGSEKSAVVGRALQACGLADHPERALMLGDRRFDVEGAGVHGVKTVLALWAGLADAEEQALAWKLAATPAQAACILLGEER